jgi:hypothetical protein
MVPAGELVGAEGLEPPTFALYGRPNAQVTGLTSGSVVTLGTSEYFRVTVSRGAGVVRDRLPAARRANSARGKNRRSRLGSPG